MSSGLVDYDYSSEEDGEEPHKGLETALATPESNASRYFIVENRVVKCYDIRSIHHCGILSRQFCRPRFV